MNNTTTSNKCVDELKNELRNKLKNELRNELKNELRDELKNELRDELKNEFIDFIKKNMTHNVRTIQNNIYINNNNVDAQDKNMSCIHEEPYDLKNMWGC